VSGNEIANLLKKANITFRWLLWRS